MSVKYLVLCALFVIFGLAAAAGLMITGEMVLIVAEIASLCMTMFCANRVAL